MENYLLKYLENYYAEILVIEGKLTVTETFLKERMAQLAAENFEYNDLITSITSYRDISMLGPVDNLFSPRSLFLLENNKLENDVTDIISQHCCLSLSQAYEVFETFLIEIVTECLSENKNYLSLLKSKIELRSLDREELRKVVKDNQDTNNKGLIRIIRKISSHFQEHECNNIYKVNICQWFYMLSMVRHWLVHNRQVITKKLLEYLISHNSVELFDRHFHRKIIGGKECIFLEKNMTVDTIHWLNGFAYFIFKSLSLELRMSSDVPQYMPPPLQFYQHF